MFQVRLLPTTFPWTEGKINAKRGWGKGTPDYYRANDPPWTGRVMLWLTALIFTQRS